MPLVSVIVPAFRSEATIAEALRSVLAQSVQDFEVLVVDDASPDGTVRAAASTGDPRVRILRHDRNRGPAAARNTALEAARGEWVAFLDADDAWHPERLARLIEVARSHPGYFVADDVVRCVPGKNGGLVPVESMFATHDVPFGGRIREATFTDVVVHGIDVKPFLSMSPIQQFRLRQREDAFGAEWLEFLALIFQRGYRLVLLNEPLYYLRLHPGSLTTDPGETLREIRACERLLTETWLQPDARHALHARARDLLRALPWVQFRRGRWRQGLAALARTPSAVPWLAGRLARMARRRLRAAKVASTPLRPLTR